MQKHELIEYMRSEGFPVSDLAYILGNEMYALPDLEGNIFWFPMDSAGSSFERIFKGLIKQVCQKETLVDVNV